MQDVYKRQDYADVAGSDWYYDAVQTVTEKGWMQGVSEQEFAPSGTVTRAMAVQTLYRLAEGVTTQQTSTFSDVAADAWYADAVAWAVEQNIATGYDDGTFQPEKAITRQEAAAILNNAFELAEKYGISTEKFPDNGAIAGWAADHVYAAKAAGLMKGDAGTGNFRPTSTITRAEAASIMMNAKNAGLIK